MSARIGPNAVIRLAEAALDHYGFAETRHLFQDAGLAHRLDDPPEAMVEEGEVVALYAALARRSGAEGVAAEAGRRTARYLLARRIPLPAQWIIGALPPRLAARALLAAIGRNAWTFAGSGAFSARTGRGVDVSVEGGPFAAPGPAAAPLAAFYGAVFETLFRALVSPRAAARAEAGAGRCAVALEWARPLPERAQAR